MSEYKLEIELVPETCFYANVRKLVTKAKWDEIRRRAYRNADHKCETCGAENVRLNCHEIWRYDDEDHVQDLEGFQALCKNCHMIKHTGFSMHTPKGMAIYDRDKLIQHFCEVNNCSRDDFLKHEEEAFEIWKERSKHDWKQPWVQEFR